MPWVISAVYNFLLKRFVTEFDGFMVSNYENQSNTLVLSFLIDLNISCKDYLQKVKLEILETLSHTDFNKEIESTYSFESFKEFMEDENIILNLK